jgi:signal transduction histidine kinase
MTVWFGIVFLAMVALFTYMTRNTLEQELRNKNWQSAYPDHPEWNLHGSYSEEEVRDISSELMVSALVWSVPLIITALVGGYWMAYQSLRPIARVNQQLATKNPDNLGKPIDLTEADDEFQELRRQLNALLSRLDTSFKEMNLYAAKVAHELRTPLAILRLKIEQADGRIAPDLAEEFESELHRLNYVVDQSLFIARAERGYVAIERKTFNLTDLVKEVLEDFQLLAAEQERHFILEAGEQCPVTADPRHLRQIIHNLFTNALKHGREELNVRVHQSNHRTILLIANGINPQPDTERTTLGLGLRVVATLLKLEPDIHYQRRQNRGYYIARLTLPSATRAEPFPA